jgi:hypothetical protein
MIISELANKNVDFYKPILVNLLTETPSFHLLSNRRTRPNVYVAMAAMAIFYMYVKLYVAYLDPSGSGQRGFDW